MTIEVVSNEVPTPMAAAPKPAEAVVETPAEQTPAPEAKPSEQKQAEVSETTETEKPEETAAEGESKPEEAEDAEVKKKKGGFQRRIDKLNARVSEREKELEYWKQQAMKVASEPKKEIEAPTTKPAAGDGKPNPDSFNTHAEFVEALTDWKTDQKLKERDQKADKTRLEIEQRKVAETYIERKNVFAKKTPDFDDVIDEVSDVPISLAVRDILMTSENGPELAYELAKNREEYVRICKLPPFAAARAIGRIEAGISSKESVTKETKSITSAPKPLVPVAGGGKAVVIKTLQEAADVSFSEYKKLREQELKKRRQA